MTLRKVLPAFVVLAVGAIVVWQFMLKPAPQTKAAGAPIVRVSVPEDLSGRAAEGEALFNENCASCHGENAAGQEGVAPPLVHVIYEPNHHGDAAFFLAVQRGVRSHHWPFGDMPPVSGVGEEDVAKIVTYVRTLQRANGID